MTANEIVGASSNRVGGRDRVTGAQEYVADIHFTGELHAKLVKIEDLLNHISFNRQRECSHFTTILLLDQEVDPLARGQLAEDQELHFVRVVVQT